MEHRPAAALAEIVAIEGDVDRPDDDLVSGLMR